MFDLINLGFRFYMDSAKNNKIYVEKDKKVRIFKPSKNGLYFHDINDHKMHFNRKQKHKIIRKKKRNKNKIIRINGKEKKIRNTCFLYDK